MGRARIMGSHVAALAQLDSVATAVSGGYDNVLREPTLVDDGSWSGAPGRVDQPEIRVPCQISDEVYNRMQAMLNGTELQHRMRLTFAWKDLERAGLLDAGTNAAAIRVTARLMGIYDRRGTLLLDTEAANLYAVEARPAAFMGASINLLVVAFECREHGVTA